MKSKALALAFLLAASGSADLIPAQPRFDFDGLNEALKAARGGDLVAARRFVDRAAAQKDQPHADILMAHVLIATGRANDGRLHLQQLATKEQNRLDLRLAFVALAVKEARWFDGLTHARAADRADELDTWSKQYVAKMRYDLAHLTAVCMEGQGQWEACARIVSTLLAKNQDDAHLLILRARCAFHLGDAVAAIDWLTRARKLDRSLDPPHLLVATLFDQKGQLKRAEYHFKQATSSGTELDRAKSRLAYGNWLIWNNRPDSIATLLESEIRDPALNDQRQLLLGLAARMRGDYESAQPILSELARKSPLEFAPANHLALVLIESGDEALRARSLQVAESNARNHPRLGEAWSTLGWVQFRLGDITKARDALTRAMSSGNISRDTAWHLARIHNQLGNKQKEQAMLQAVKSASGPLFSAQVASSD